MGGGEGGWRTGLVEVGAAGSFNLSAIFLRTDPSIFRYTGDYGARARESESERARDVHPPCPKPPILLF